MIVQIIVKARLQIAETNVLLHKMYSYTYWKLCTICRIPHDTISHVLNGCMEFRLDYAKSHNRIIDIIFEAIYKYNQALALYKTNIVTADLINMDDELQMTDYFHTINASKPDLFLEDYAQKQWFFLVVSVSFDAYIDDCYEGQFQMYVPLF